MLYREIIAVCSQIHHKTHKYTVWVQNVEFVNVNPLTPNDSYRGHTAPLTSKVAFYIFIQ